jgi:hypothetical protein
MVSADIPPFASAVQHYGPCWILWQRSFTGCARHEPERFSERQLVGISVVSTHISV